ncbi:MAG: zf-HC2 domain-containing protein [Candidatus Aminicenantes bacterium]|nr:zf-HC2 domain-containing protein [Candidatus Aminicenantes bacterium]MDH5704694.1 zf-HC2 domain-containing protein [Candidatus Aminicenantes bacterium]
MRCKTIEKWLSDRIDGELSERKIKSLQAHLERCPSCRSYAAALEKIQDEARSIERLEVSPSFWEEFTSRLRSDLSSKKQEKRLERPLVKRWRWAGASAALTLLIVVGLYFLLFFEKPVPEMYVFSYEDSLAQIYREIGRDPELETLFNLVVLASIGESLEGAGWQDSAGFQESSLLWENLSEEELKLIESEIKKEEKIEEESHEG